MREIAALFVLLALAAGAPSAPRAEPAALCGDLNLDRSVDFNDVLLNRLALADPVGNALSAQAQERCGVLDLPGDCGILQVVVMQRALVGGFLLPGINPVCDAAQGTSVTPSFDPNFSVGANIGPLGGVLVTEDALGTQYTLSLPVDAIAEPDGFLIRMTPITSLAGYPGSGDFIAGVKLEPEGLVLLESGLLSFRIAAALDLENVLGFSASGDGEGLYFVPGIGDVPSFTHLTIPVNHFTIFGAGEGNQADVDANRAPQRPVEGSFMQELIPILNSGDLEDPAVQQAITDLINKWALREIEDLLLSPPTCENLDKRLGSIGQLLDATSLFEASSGGLFSFSAQLTSLGTVLAALLEKIQNEQLEKVKKACIVDPCATQIELDQANATCLTVAHEMNQRLGIESLPFNFDELDNACGSLRNLSIGNDQGFQISGVALCPGDSRQLTFLITDVTGSSGVTDTITWSTANTDVATVDPSGGLVTAGASPGRTTVIVENGCGARHEIPVVVMSAPDISGSFFGSGKERVYSCLEDADNGTFRGSGVLSITQTSVPDSAIAEIVGSASGAGFVSGFIAILGCGGEFVGSGSFTEMEPCEEGQPEICITRGTLTVRGNVTRTTGPPATPIGTSLDLKWHTQDTVGDTCGADGTANVDR